MSSITLWRRDLKADREFAETTADGSEFNKFIERIQKNLQRISVFTLENIARMGILDDELKEVSQCVEKQVSNCKLEACVRAMVRARIQPTKYKQIVVCMQFPEHYPTIPVLVELKSKYVSQKLLAGLTKMCEEQNKKIIGKPQILSTIKFVGNFIDENPLCCCSEEISSIRKLLGTKDDLKLKQKTSTVVLIIQDGNYFLKYAFGVPNTYPDNKISIEEKECTYPPVLRRWFLAQSTEIARKCVMPPAKQNPKEPPFVRKPSLQPVVQFLLEEAHKYPSDICPCCRETCLPLAAEEVELDEFKSKFVDRIYCGHIYHFECLDQYIRAPPFQGGKKCVECGLRIYHDKWKLTTEVAEKRWAYKQAKQRELDEVVDFLS